MIARSVHNHTPENQLNNPVFKRFLVEKAGITGISSSHINIDKMPLYSQNYSLFL
jgi:hypothetical protein